MSAPTSGERHEHDGLGRCRTCNAPLDECSDRVADGNERRKHVRRVESTWDHARSEHEGRRRNSERRRPGDAHKESET
jgi:hypothetical protein